MRHGTEFKEFSPNKNFISFFELSGQQFEDFKKQVAEHDWILEVYIHPFFHSNQIGQASLGPKYAKEKAIETKINHRLSSQNPNPSLIFEEDDYQADLESHIQHPQHPVIFVITKPNSAKPIDQNKPGDAPLLITSRLKEADVKEIQLAGATLIKKWRKGKPVYEGCIGEAAEIFGKNFKISFLEDLTVTDARPKPPLRYDEE